MGWEGKMNEERGGGDNGWGGKGRWRGGGDTGWGGG